MIIGYNYPLEAITTNFELAKKYNPSSFLVCHNDYCASPDADLYRNVYWSHFDGEKEGFLNGRVKNIYIVYPDKNFINDIKVVDVHVGNKNYYYTNKDIQKFEKKEFSIKLDKSQELKKYNAVVLPEINNYKGILRHLNILFLSFLHSNWLFYVVACFLFYAAFLIFHFNKEKFNFKFELDDKKAYIILGLIIALGAFIRFLDITYYPLWCDEIYTKGAAIQNLKTCFLDAGNPPLFFILEYLFTRIFSTSDLALKFLPCVFGISLIPVMFLLFKEICGKKAGLFAAFMTAVNMLSIYHSQEARAYSLDMLLSVGAIYLLFKYLNNTTTKNLVFYALITFLMINTNYYLVLLSFTNFIWGIFDLIENKKTGEIKKFFLANFIAALTFLPYALVSAKTALSPIFNGWIAKISHNTFVEIIQSYFIEKNIFLMLSAIVFINLVYCFLPLKNKNKKKENFYIYLIYTLTFIIILASAISLFAKAILHQRLLVSVYGIFLSTVIMTIISVVELANPSKFFFSLKALYSLALTLIALSISNVFSVREYCNLYDFMNFVKNDIQHYQDYEIHVVTCDVKEYLNAYPEMKKIKNINWHFIYTNSGKVIKTIKKENYTKKDHKVVIYFNAIGVDTGKILPLNPKAYAYRSNLHNICAKIVYD